MKILFTGGGTGGHIFPIIAVTREIRNIYLALSEEGKGRSLQFSYLGPKDDFSSILLSQEGISVKKIMAGKVRRYFTWKALLLNFLDIFFKVPIGFLQAFFHIFFLAPDLIFSKGGYGSLPSVLAGWILQVPIFLHESDISPGLANRFLSRFSLEIFTSFPKTDYFPLHKMILVGNPIRKEILEGSARQAKETFYLTGEKPIILVLGGSQGAQKINDTLFAVLPDLLTEFELIHQCGEKNFEQLRAEQNVVITESLKRYYHLFPFLREQELKKAYAISFLIINRAGSGSIFEIAALGKPSILIPLPLAAQDHQLKNAYSFAQNGACMVIEEENLTPNFLLEKLKDLIGRKEELEKMKKGALEFARPKAGRIIAEYIVEYLTR